MPGGFAESLVDYARGKYPIDFQFRADPKRPRRPTAMLYVGLTKVLDVEGNAKGELRLGVHQTWKQMAGKLWKPQWESWLPPGQWAEEWAQVERFLETAIPNIVVGGKYVRTEGIVQAAVSGFLDPARVVIDREVVPGFWDTPTRKVAQDRFSLPLVEALERAGFGRHKPFGMECDALAIDAAGHLVAIEIKPGSAGSLRWVAAQATMYAKVLQHWVDTDSENWRDVITGMFEQRSALGLTPPGFVLPELQPVVVPAVAFQRVAAAAYVKDMYAVQEALVREGVGDDRLSFYAVAPSGRLDNHVWP